MAATIFIRQVGQKFLLTFLQKYDKLLQQNVIGPTILQSIQIVNPLNEIGNTPRMNKFKNWKIKSTINQITKTKGEGLCVPLSYSFSF